MKTTKMDYLRFKAFIYKIDYSSKAGCLPIQTICYEISA